MKKNLTRQWVAALMVAAGLLMALPVAAQKTTKDIDKWSNNDNFGKNGANTTADGYSLWDGQSMQYYGFNKDGDIEIYNAAQLARYAWDMYQANSYIRSLPCLFPGHRCQCQCPQPRHDVQRQLQPQRR